MHKVKKHFKKKLAEV